MKRGFDPPLPAQAYCRLCERLFCYFRRTSPRLYCAPCVEIERKTANVFFNNKAREDRIAARENARMAHA